MQTTNNHPLDLRDPEQQGRGEPVELTAALIRRVTEEWTRRDEAKREKGGAP
jgi:hypothetical protein